MSFLTASVEADAPQPVASARAVIEMRRDAFNDIGWATKAINDQLKKSSPDLAIMSRASETISTRSRDIAQWFPVGSGRESGFDTDALPGIWKDRAMFDQLAGRLVTETQNLKLTMARGDLAAIRSQLKAVRDTCSTCHRSFLASR